MQIKPMKKYDDISTAPLKFHKLYKYIMPLLGANALANLVLGIKMNGFANTATTIDYIYDVLIFGCVVFGVYGSLYWKPIGWYGIMGLQVFQIAYAVLAYVMLSVTDNLPDKMLQQMALKVILPILIGIYYFNRKGVFFNTTVQKAPKKTADSSEIIDVDDYEEIEDEEEVEEEFEEIEE